jgi:hypothetical protein
MQRVRCVQRTGVESAKTKANHQQTKNRKAGNFHPGNILSTMDFVSYFCLSAAYCICIGVFRESILI